jgi:hypothetical protein
MEVTEMGRIEKGGAKRTFKICFAQASEILNISIACWFVLRAGQRYILAAKDVPLIKILLHRIFLD